MSYEFPKRAPLPLRVELDHGASGYKVSALTTWNPMDYYDIWPCIKIVANMGGSSNNKNV